MVIDCDVWLILIVGFGGCCWCCVGFEFGFVCLLFLACGLLIGGSLRCGSWLGCICVMFCVV